MTNFEQSISSDIAALESLFFQETNNYHNSATLQNKPWYGIGLEDIDTNTQKDSGNKRSIVNRILDAIIGFIASILKRIKAIFIVDEDKVEIRKQAKAYEGPTDEDLAKAAAKYAQRNKANDKPAGKPTDGDKSKDNTTSKEPSSKTETLEEAIARASKVTGKTVTVDTVKEFFNADKMGWIIASLGEDRVKLVAAMLEDSYYKQFDMLTKAVVSLKGKDIKDASSIVGPIKAISEEYEQCDKFIKTFETKDFKEARNKLSNWVMGKDLSRADLAHSYFDPNANVDTVVGIIRTYLESLRKQVETLKNSTEQEAINNLKIYKESITDLAKVIALTSKMDNAYYMVIKGLNKNKWRKE